MGRRSAPAHRRGYRPPSRQTPRSPKRVPAPPGSGRGRPVARHPAWRPGRSGPGSRRESLENYIKRLEKLEEIAYSFKGVSKSYAIQAGREIRVIVEHGEINDEQAKDLAGQVAQKIQAEVEYPGQIKVTVIR